MHRIYLSFLSDLNGENGFKTKIENLFQDINLHLFHLLVHILVFYMI